MLNHPGFLFLMQKNLQCGKYKLNLEKPIVMGILNVTPDSFSDGGRYDLLDNALKHAIQLQKEGVDIIDVGGESTRPGAQPVNVQEELDRVIPVIEKINSQIDLPVSIDTSKALVMTEAVSSGAVMVNDVMALQQPGATEAVAMMDESIAVCLMHMQGQPRTMQENPVYDDVVEDVFGFLQSRVIECEQAGIERNRIVIDPGFGFGKTLEHNIALLKHLSEFKQSGLPVLAGISRKSMLGKLLGDVPPEQRIDASVAAAVLAYERGANILRVHDVKQTVDALKIVHALI
jgi:dihydropteroate synthase